MVVVVYAHRGSSSVICGGVSGHFLDGRQASEAAVTCSLLPRVSREPGGEQAHTGRSMLYISHIKTRVRIHCTLSASMIKGPGQEASVLSATPAARRRPNSSSLQSGAI